MPLNLPLVLIFDLEDLVLEMIYLVLTVKIYVVLCDKDFVLIIFGTSALFGDSIIYLVTL